MERAPATLTALRRQPDPARRVSLALAIAWIDQQVVAAPAAESVPLSRALGRILARGIIAGLDSPAVARAAIAGVAVRAEALIGAHSFQPVGLRLTRGAIDQAGATAVPVAAGEPLPEGADAVVAHEACVFPTANGCEIFAPVAPGQAVEPAGSHFSRGTLLLAAGQHLDARHCALMASAGLSEAALVRQPRVELILEAPDQTTAAVSLLLKGLIDRDGGILAAPPRSGLDQARETGQSSQSDMIVIVGRADSLEAPAVRLVAAWGEVCILGVALAPGEATAIGLSKSSIPVFVLPATPAGCLFAYEWLAGRALRRLAGRRPCPPLNQQMMMIRGKIVSRIGMTEVFPVRRLDKRLVEPAGALDDTDLLGAVRADGFVITAEGSEGHSDGSLVVVHVPKSCDESAGLPAASPEAI
jgi:molybdopterin molybdotransferase